jgi:hypothetical protein
MYLQFLKSIIYEIFVGEKFKLCHFDAVASEEGVDNINADNERECLRLQLTIRPKDRIWGLPSNTNLKS